MTFQPNYAINLLKVLQGHKVEAFDINAALLPLYLFTPIQVTYTDNPIDFLSGSNVYTTGSFTATTNVGIALSGSTVGDFYVSLLPDEGFIRGWSMIQWTGSIPGGSDIQVDLLDSRGNMIASDIGNQFFPYLGEEDVFNGTGEETVFALTYVSVLPVSAVIVNGNTMIEGVDFTVDYVVSQVTFVNPPSIGIGNIVIQYYHPGAEQLTLHVTLSGSNTPIINWIKWQIQCADRLYNEVGGKLV